MYGTTECVYFLDDAFLFNEKIFLKKYVFIDLQIACN